MSWVTLAVLVVFGSCSWTPAGGQTSCSAAQFTLSTVTASAESVDGPTPAARVTWSTTVPPQCVGSVRVEFRIGLRSGPVVATYTTTNASQTEVIQTGLQCATNYYITVVVTGATSDIVRPTVISRPVQVFVGDIPTPVRVRAEVTPDSTSIRVSWNWQGVPKCANNVTVHYQPEGGSLMMYSASNTTTTSASLPNLQCSATEYTIWVEARGGLHNRMSAPSMISLPARAPPTPTGVTAQFISISTVRVTWQWTSSGPAPNCFNTTTVTYRPEGGGESFLQLRDPAATETILTGLQCSTNYTITVVATAGEHRREGSVFLQLQVTIGAPRSLDAMFVQSTEVSLSRREVPCDQNGYIVRYYATCGASRNVQQSKSVVTTSVTIDGLTPFTEYVFQVAAIGTGPFTETNTLGGAPRLVVVTPVNSTSVVLSWSEVQCFSGSGAVTHYLVQYHSSCCGGGTVQNVTTDGLVQVISGLTPNTVYTFRVAAVGVGQNIGPFSHPVNTSLPDTPHISCETSTSALAAVTVVAFVTLLVLLAVTSAVIWYQQRSIARMKGQSQR